MGLQQATRPIRRKLARLFHDHIIPGQKRKLARRVRRGKSFSLYDLDHKVMKYLPDRPGYFIELGANDGISQSNTYLLEAKHGWRGLLIEAVPHKFFQCKENRSQENSFACAAAVDFDYSERFVEMQYSGLMSIGETSTLDGESHSQDGVQFLAQGEEVVRFGAPARTMTSILDEVSAPERIDFLSLDVEGAELSVLNGIDFDRYSFAFMLIECADRQAIETLLAAHGYEHIDQLSHHDHLFRGPGKN